MQIAKKRFGALVLGICLLVALAFGGHSVAQAASWWPNPGNNELTIYPTGNDKLWEDLADAGAYVLLFKVANAEPENDYEAFTYTYTDEFGGGLLPAPEVDAPGATQRWQEMAKDAAKQVEEESPSEPAERGDFSKERGCTDEITLQTDGIYLAVVYSEYNELWHWNEDHSTTITGARAEYTFMPQLIALPSKSADGSKSASSDSGPWRKELTITLKPEIKERYGSLTINKTVVDPTSDESATFVFHIVDTETGGEKYENYAAITWPAANQTTVTHIPAGMEVTVTEQYEGARFDADGSAQEVTIKADADEGAPVSVSFTNKGNDNETGGGNGIQNNFELTKTGEGESAWDWTWTATPSQQ